RVHAGHGAERGRGRERVTRVQIAAAALAVVERQQNLRGRDAEAPEDVVVRVREENLAGRGRGLLVLQTRAARVDLELARSQRDGARGDDDDFLARLAECRDV